MEPRFVAEMADSGGGGGGVAVVTAVVNGSGGDAEISPTPLAIA